MLTEKINLAALKSAIRTLKGKNGEVECLIIPIKENMLYKGNKGIYLDIVGFEIDKAKHPDTKDTHLLKQSFSKEKRESMTEEELNAIPILGNLTDWDKITETTPSENIPETIEQEEIKDDLPF